MDSGDGIHLPLMVVFCFRLCLLVHIVHRSGRTPLLPLYALLLFKEPSELTLRTLYELDAYRAYPKENPLGVTAGAGFLSA